MAKGKKNNAPEGAITRSGGVAELTIAHDLFTPVSEVKLDKDVKFLVQSPMIKPKDFPVDMWLRGILTKTFVTNPGKDNQGKEKYGVGIEIVPPGKPVGLALACTAVLMTNLGIKTKGEGREMEITCPYIGADIGIRKLPDRIPNKRGLNEAWNFVVAVHKMPEKNVTG